MENCHTDPSSTNATGNTIKDPEDWTTGDEPMTGAQRSYLQTLCNEANEPMDESLTKAQASERIEVLQQKTGRGMGANQNSSSRGSGATGNPVKDPEDWTTGDEPMTGAQRSYLQTLSDEANEPMDETLTKAQASERIEALQQKTGRGTAPREQAGRHSACSKDL
jgi:uncharacterized damage-inducible protein DinB